MPSNSLDFNQILIIAPLGHMQTIDNVIKDTSLNQEHHLLQQELYKCHQSQREFLMPLNSSDFNQISKSSSTPAKNLQMSLIFEGVLDAFKLIGFQSNFDHSSLRAYADH